MTNGQELHRKYHEVASVFPLMVGEDFENLKADIADNGLREAVWLHPDGSIIDGRNRHRACIETNTAPRFRTWDGQGSLVTFVVSMNLHRRHLTSSQRAVVALEVLPMLEAEAKERQIRKPSNFVVEIMPQQKSREQAAERGLCRRLACLLVVEQLLSTN